MFSEMLKQYKATLPDFPSSRRPRVGFVIREIRTNRGIRQMDLANQVKINQSTFKSLENDHQKATTVDNLTRCAKELNVSAEELILLGREYDPANLFAMKRSNEITHIEGLRQKKHTPEDWFQSVRIRFKDFDITPISAPINMKRDFFVCRVVIPPKRTITNLELGAHIPVIGYVIDGFNLKMRYAGSEHSLTSGQAYALDGFFKHSISNDNEDQAAILYWVTKVPNESLQRGTPRSMSDKKNTINISKGVDVLRRHISDRTHRAMSLKHFSDLTDTLNERQINEMTRLKQGSSVVYWEKIEDLLSAGDVTMEDFLSWSKGLEPSPFTIATARTRAWVEYPNSGLKIYCCTPPCLDNKFFTGEIFLEGLNQIKKDGWERRDKAMLAFYVEEGDIQIFAGKRKKTFNLSKGESIYLDGNLGYTLRNVSKTQARLFLATFKSISL